MAAAVSDSSPKVADTLLSRVRNFAIEGKQSKRAEYEQLPTRAANSIASAPALHVIPAVVPVQADTSGDKWRCCIFGLLFFAIFVLVALMAYDFSMVSTTGTPSSPIGFKTGSVRGVPSSSSGVAVTTEVVFDCDADFENFLSSWSNAKKEFCCKKRNRGCVPSAPYHCFSGREDSWPLSKQNYCCETHKVGCLKYDCAAGLPFAHSGWSESKKDFCCKRFGEGCAFDCLADLAHAATAWSENQKSWCCRHEKKGCESMTESKKPGNCSVDCYHDGKTATCVDRIAYASKHTYTGHVDACQKAHQLVQRECDSCSHCTLEAAKCTTPHPSTESGDDAYEWYDCKTDLTSNSTLAKKRSWCCEHQGKGCHEGERPSAKPADGMKWASSTVNGTIIWEQVKENSEHVEHI